MSATGAEGVRFGKWGVRFARACWRLLPYAAFVLLVSNWFGVYFATLSARIGGLVGTLGILAVLWNRAGAPAGEESEAVISRALLDRRSRIAVGALTLLFVILTFKVSAVSVELAAPTDGPIEFFARRDSTTDSVRVGLSADRPRRILPLVISHWGSEFIVRRGVEVARVRVRPWALGGLTYPTDFTGPVRLNVLLAPSLMGNPLKAVNRIVMTRGATGEVLADTTISALTPRGFVLAVTEPPLIDSTDTRRWKGLATAAGLGDSAFVARLVGLWGRSTLPWVRASKEFAVGDPVRITVTRDVDGTLTVHNLKLSERVSDVILQRNP